MKFSDATQDYLLHIKVERGLAKTTCDTYQAWLHNFQRWMTGNGHPDDLDSFTTTVLRRYLYDLAKKNYRPRTIRGVFHPIRGIGVFLVEADFLTANPVDGLMITLMPALTCVISPESCTPVRGHQPREAKLFIRRAIQEAIDRASAARKQEVDTSVGPVMTLSAAPLRCTLYRTRRDPPEAVLAASLYLVRKIILRP